MKLWIQPTLLGRIKVAQREDHKLQEFREQVKTGLRTDMQIHTEKTLHFCSGVVYRKGRFDKK